MNRKGDVQEVVFDPARLAGKRIVVFVHGYNAKQKGSLGKSFAIQDFLVRRRGADAPHLYDAAMAVIWPGGGEGWEYFEARGRVPELAEKVCCDLAQVLSVAGRVDVIAHSMGNRLMFEALKLYRREGKVDDFYAVGPAVDNESIQTGEVYGSSMERCRRVWICHSLRDTVLKLSYPIAEWDRALGFSGPEDDSRKPRNVCCVDWTDVIGEHSEYFLSAPFYRWVLKNLAQPEAPPFRNREFKAFGDGLVRPLQPSAAEL